ncbi:uroporphyrinogen-III C-methyltransferase [Roseospirillum parvum]|uniref:uroporphyrinogen-III C-methyltransferase n=1 Tax=Roseospirillum parvum TaxID=83401 RepID=A0A1G8BW72_9PROT|nr:uroporphyrinogen-III C-methyltransferase [Roseospirillum parvum]SDH37425.1 uroporphyrin-III C-methyltransferase / precorrin-2 dehydrogenase / sirohydrochlorin ferrochelatase/uroporphyrin-III C-methyltransferase [Roseospirillum parvum]
MSAHPPSDSPGGAGLRPGMVYLVGAGPGDPELLTVKAARLLAGAEVVVYDRLVSPPILDLIGPGTSRIYAGKALDRHHLPQDEINQLLVTLARTGRSVVRLKGGDPYIFGRGSEEAACLAAAGIPFEVVPGITAAAGGAAYAGIPLTHRGLASSVRFLTGHGADNMALCHDWAGLADPNTTLVVYMGLTNLGDIVEQLIAHGMDPATPAAAVQAATTPAQRRVVATVATLAEAVEKADLEPPTLLVLGRVVELAETLAWFGAEAATLARQASG